jgi:thiamine-phosphate pyrophosphorylase
MKEAHIDIPIVAIGGITEKDISELMQIPISGIALSGSILRAENPIEEMKKIIKLTESWKN